MSRLRRSLSIGEHNRHLGLQSLLHESFHPPVLTQNISFAMAAIAPDLHIPPSSEIVEVSIIDTTSSILGVDAWKFLEPSIPGHDYLATPAFSFLVHHPKLDRSIIFDLGIRHDWWNYSPFLQERFKKGGYVISVEKSVRTILEDHGVDAKKIEAVVWSHHHFDHTGAPEEFESSTALIVGPGFKDTMLPGYPSDPQSTILEANFAGRELLELDFSEGLKIGRMNAIDYFKDGSFFFLDSPGHAVGHICALARVTSDPPSFILMGGDAVHHGGELRPSQYLPLPKEISPHPFTSLAQSSCPGSLFDGILRDGDRSKTIYEPARQTKVQMNYDVDEAIRTIEKLQEADVRDDVLFVAAHDASLLDIVEFFPRKANSFMQKGWVQQARWRFLMDFAKAVGYEGLVQGKREWSVSGE